MAGNEQFIIDIDKFVAGFGEKNDRFMVEFVQDLGKAVMENTPVLTGFLRGSWSASVNHPDESPATGSSGYFIAAALSFAKGEDVFYLTNNTSYGPDVEFGTSKMEPRAMVRRTIAQAPLIAAATAKRISPNG